LLNLSLLPDVFRRVRDLPSVGAFVHEDEWRLSNAHFGPRFKPFTPNGTALIWGLRSGLETALIAACNPETNISIIEASEWGRKRAVDLLGPDVTCYRSLQEALASSLPEHLDFVRIELDSSRSSDIEALLQSRSVGHLCGEIDDRFIDPLSLYRLCSLKTQSFFLFLREALHSIAGTRRTAPVEVSAVLFITGDEQHLAECLACLTAQISTELEVIVLDHAGAPEVRALVDGFVAGHPRRKVIRPAAGESLSLEAGIAAASGSYVGVLSGNALPLPGMYEDLFRAAALRGADVAECGLCIVDGQGHSHYQYPDLPTSADNGRVLTDGVGHLRIRSTPSNLIFKREFLNVLRSSEIPHELRPYREIAFVFSAMARAGRVVTVADQLCIEHHSRDAVHPGARDRLSLPVLEHLFAQVIEIADLRLLRRLREIEMNELAGARESAAEVESSLNRRYGPILGEIKFRGPDEAS
jgi:hypothetical protein